MRNIRQTGLSGTYIQISKSAARKMFIAGETIYLQSSNVMPMYIWQPCIPFQYDPQKDEKPADELFESTVFYFKLYVCVNKETGTYVSFYKYEPFKENPFFRRGPMTRDEIEQIRIIK